MFVFLKQTIRIVARTTHTLTHSIADIWQVIIIYLLIFYPFLILDFIVIMYLLISQWRRVMMINATVSVCECAWRPVIVNFM